MTESWGVVANIHGDRLYRNGAKVWVLSVPGDPENALVHGISLGGRRITRWVRTKRLTNFRAKFSPSPRLHWCEGQTREHATQSAADHAKRADWVRAEAAKRSAA